MTRYLYYHYEGHIEPRIVVVDLPVPDNIPGGIRFYFQNYPAYQCAMHQEADGKWSIVNIDTGDRMTEHEDSQVEALRKAVHRIRSDHSGNTILGL